MYPTEGSNSKRAIPQQVKLIEMSSVAVPLSLPVPGSHSHFLNLFIFAGLIFCWFSSRTDLSRELINVGTRGKGKTGSAVLVCCIWACCLGIKGKSGVVTCIICLPLSVSTCFAYHFTFVCLDSMFQVHNLTMPMLGS